MATRPEQPKLRSVLPSEAITNRPASDAFAAIFAPSEKREGGRHGALGAPGYGKTHHAASVIREAFRRRAVDLVLTHDVKGRVAEFEGHERLNPGDLAARPVLAPPAHVVFRGDPRADIQCDPEAVAALGFALVRLSDPLRVMLNLNELDQALTDGGRSWTAPSVRKAITQGRALEYWVCWTTQSPHRTPNEILDLSTTIALFHMDGRSARYLESVAMLDPEMVECVPRLGIGQFVLWRPGRDWDRVIYGPE